MARIVGAMSASHAPSIATLDRDGSPPIRALFRGFAAMRERIAALQPDALVVVYDDHVDNFFFNAFPTFAIGVGESFAPADEGRGAADVPPIPGRPKLAGAIARHLIEQGGFDLTICHELRADHGLFVPMNEVKEQELPIVPIVINTVQEPFPTARRCWTLGRALAAAIEAAPGEDRIVIVGTGGLAHQLGGERFGWIAEEFDRRFLKLLTDGPREAVAEYTNDEIDAAGNGTNEIRNWIAVAGAVPVAPARVVYYEPLGITGTGILLYDVEHPDPDREAETATTAGG
jgi:protocatechuate 4,5-dioxygenase beta chain